MTINEVHELKVGDTVVFNGGHSAIVMEIQALGDDRIEYVLKDALEKTFRYDDADISRLACGSYRYRGLSPKAEALKRSYDEYRDYCKHYKHDGYEQYLIVPRGAAKSIEMYKQRLNARYGIGTERMLPEIADVIFSGPATIVRWTDGTKTVVKCSKGENFDPEKGLVMAITKKALGNKGNYYETIKKWMHPDITVLKTITVKSNGVETEINKVSFDDIVKIIETRKPEGNFYCYYKEEKKYIAFYNKEGDAWTRYFKDEKSCLDWLEKKHIAFYNEEGDAWTKSL